MKYDLITKWLSLFGNSFISSLNDLGGSSKGGFDWSLNHTIQTYIKLNEGNPYGLFFTPNGNYGNINKVGDKVSRSISGGDGSIHAFYVDVDMKETEYTSKQKLLDDIKKIIHKDNLPVSYIVESGGGFHLYMFVDKQYVKKLKGIKFKEIQEEFAGRFPGGDKSSHSYNKLMRLPFSNHWKSAEPIELILYRVYKNVVECELEVITNPEDIEFPETYLPEAFILNINDNLKEKSQFRLDLSVDKEKELSNDMATINNIPLQKIIFILSNKNEIYRKEYLGYYYRFILDGIRINIETTDVETGVVNDILTSGYRINIEENYVNNFSFEKHSIEERPRGGAFAFLYYYFDKDVKKIREFLEKEFGIILELKQNYGYLNIKTFNGVIIFSKEGVFYNKEVKSNKGVDVIQKTLFEIPIKIKGVFNSKYTTFGESDHSHNYYLITRLDAPTGEEDIIVDFNVDRKSFNRHYGSTGLVFFGTEEDMLSFFSAINKAAQAGQIPTLDFEYLNGIKKDKVILGSNVYDTEFNLYKDDNLVLKTQHIETNFIGKEHISIKDFGIKFQQLFSPRVSVLGLSTFVTLFLGHDFWNCIQSIKQQALIPGLIVSGKTRAGKTTMLSILKEGAGLSIDTRKFSIKSTTLQPIKQAATDSFILHLEEFTGDISPDKETIIRDILNKSVSSRGTITGDNINYVFRSSLLLDGERLPTSQSVVNRTVLIPMFEQDKMGDEKTLSDIKQYCFLKDMCVKAMSIKEEDKINAFLKAEDVLLSKGIKGRNVLLYSFVLATNYLLNIVDNSKLIDTIKENFSILGEADLDTDDISSLLSHVIITNRIRPSIDYGLFQDTGGVKMKGSISLSADLIAEKRIDIINLIKTYRNEVKLDGYTLIFDSDTMSPIGSKLLNYKQYFNF